MGTRIGLALSTGIGVALLGCGAILGIDEVGYGSGSDPRDAGSGSDAPVYPYDSGGGRDASVADAATDTLSSYCPCPAGTTGSAGDCTLVSPRSNGACDTPLAVPFCTMTLHFQLCSTDPTFTFVNGSSDSACQFDGGSDSRVAAFFKLASATSYSYMALNGSAGSLLAVPNAGCTASDPILCRDEPASVTRELLTLTNFIVGKEGSGACDSITMTITPL